MDDILLLEAVEHYLSGDMSFEDGKDLSMEWILKQKSPTSMN